MPVDSPTQTVVSPPRSSASQHDSISGLFPLPLTPLETFLVWDESKDCPLTSFIELHFETRLDRKALQISLDEVAEHHPLLACRIESKDHRLRWHYERDLSPLLLDAQEYPVTTGPASNPCPRPFNLFRESGVRFWLSEEGTGSRIIIQLHHACCDGVGMRQVLLSTLSAYAKRTTRGNDPEVAQADSATPTRKRRLTGTSTDVARLADRFDFTELESKPPKVRLSVREQIRNAYYFHFQRPTELLPDTGDQGNHQVGVPASDCDGDRPLVDEFKAGEPLVHYMFDESTSTRILDACRDRSIGVNDLALAALMATCQKWNASLGDDSAGSRLRLLMPVDLRSRKDLELPATNRLSFSFLGRTQGQCGDFAELLESVCEETQKIKDTRVYMDFLHGLSAVFQRPRLMRWVIGKSRRMTTSVLTYAGDISRGMKNHFPEVDGRRQVGDALLSNVLICPPPRQHANVSLGLCVNWGQICVSASWNRNVFDAPMTDRFLKLYAQQWHNWLTVG